jgi:hypothetical protein
MVESGSIILGVVAILSALFRAFLKPKFDQAGDVAYIPSSIRHCKQVADIFGPIYASTPLRYL